VRLPKTAVGAAGGEAHARSDAHLDVLAVEQPSAQAHLGGFGGLFAWRSLGLAASLVFGASAAASALGLALGSLLDLLALRRFLLALSRRSLVGAQLGASLPPGPSARCASRASCASCAASAARACRRPSVVARHQQQQDRLPPPPTQRPVRSSRAGVPAARLRRTAIGAARGPVAELRDRHGHRRSGARPAQDRAPAGDRLRPVAGAHGEPGIDADQQAGGKPGAPRGQRLVVSSSMRSKALGGGWPVMA
jgi:hypothetical protein